MCVFLNALFPPFSPFLILGPLTKKQNDDLGDNEGTEDEGIFDSKPYAWPGTSNILLYFS